MSAYIGFETGEIMRLRFVSYINPIHSKDINADVHGQVHIELIVKMLGFDKEAAASVDGQGADKWVKSNTKLDTALPTFMQIFAKTPNMRSHLVVATADGTLRTYNVENTTNPTCTFYEYDADHKIDSILVMHIYLPTSLNHFRNNCIYFIINRWVKKQMILWCQATFIDRPRISKLVYFIQ